MEESQYLWCFLLVTIIAMIALHNYPLVFTRKKKGKELSDQTVTRYKKTMSKPAHQYVQYQGDPQRAMEATRYGSQIAGYEGFANPMVSNNAPDNRHMRYAQQPAVPQQYDEPPLQIMQPDRTMPYQQENADPIRSNLYQQQSQGHQGPPPPIETNPRKQDATLQMPQNGIATPQQEIERFSLQEAATHTESMSGDNFFQAGGISPANGSEWGSPI